MGVKILLSGTVAIGLTVFGQTGAFALDNEEICTAKSSDSYSCVEEWGYVGEDPYDVDQFSEGGDKVPKHGCTSFAAYMISLFSPWMPAISHFDSAQYWDTQAASRTPATLSVVPHVGDIAQWNAKGELKLGHVAFVTKVVRNAAGKLLHIDVADDNGGRKITTQRRLYPGVQTGTIRWPDNFITFPKTLTSFGGGGGTLINMQSIPLNGGEVQRK